MKMNDTLENLEKFERLLRQFEEARDGILGTRTENTVSGQLDKIEEAHISLDDFRLAAVREYEALRPVIKDFSRCFTSVNEMDEKTEETYLALIEHGTRSFKLVYDDLAFIKNQLKQHDSQDQHYKESAMVG
jgi:hypothetical protein